MYREINLEKIKTLEKDLLNTISEIKSIITIGEEVFVKEPKEIYALRYLLIEAVEAMANICNHILTRLDCQVFESNLDSDVLNLYYSIPRNALARNAAI
jgi:uncharacterized protein YutE (UPF0331/DUF86 family)